MSALDGLIYFPDREMPPPPPGVEERAFVAGDGVRLHGWYVPARTAEAPTLLWSHGNAGNVAGREDVLLALAARGLAVFAYDYRGYGRSEGKPSEDGLYRDAAAAWDDLVAHGTGPSRIVCIGESLGGAVSIALAAERPCAAVIVVATFPSLRDVARAHYGVLAALARNQFDAGARIGSLDVPILIAHGDADEIVPFALGEQLYALAPKPKQFVRVPGKHHNDVFDSPVLLDEIAAFARAATRAPGEPLA